MHLERPRNLIGGAIMGATASIGPEAIICDLSDTEVTALASYFVIGIMDVMK